MACQNHSAHAIAARATALEADGAAIGAMYGELEEALLDLAALEDDAGVEGFLRQKATEAGLARKGLDEQVRARASALRSRAQGNGRRARSTTQPARNGATGEP